MPSFLITDEEMDTLYEMNHMDYVIYLWLRKYMDFSTGIVGVRRRISYQMLCEILSVPVSAGVQGVTPTLSAIRCSIDKLCKQGLIEKIEQKQSLVFNMPLALTTKAQVAPQVCPQEAQQTYSRPTADQAQQTYSRHGMAQPCDSQVCTMYDVQQTSGDEKRYEVQQTSEHQNNREGKGETPLQTPLAGAPECAPFAASMPETASIELEPTPTAKKPRSTRTKASPASQPALALPDWIDPKTWHDYEAHRKGLRKPLVNGSTTHVLRDLEKLRAQGHDPNAVLSQSIVRGWVGVFPLAGEHPCQTFVPGNRTAKPGGIDLGPSGRSTRDAAERWLNNSNSIENAQENPEP